MAGCPPPRRRLHLRAVAAVLLAGAAAAGAPAAATGCGPDGGTPVRVAAVNADWSLSLADGRGIRLVGIEPLRAAAGDPALAEAGRARLSRWLAGHDAVFTPAGPATDRWGRVTGTVFAAASDGPPDAAAPLSVALALVDAGLARARPEPGAAACWTAMLTAEQAARTDRRGLWTDPSFAVLEPAQQAALAAAAGRFVVVEGRVASLGRGRSRLFVRLGERGASVVVSLARRDLFILDQLGLNEDVLRGTVLRVRGDLADRRGPSIDVTDAAQVEVMGAPVRSGPAVAP